MTSEIEHQEQRHAGARKGQRGYEPCREALPGSLRAGER